MSENWLPPRGNSIKILLSAAEKAANECSSNHPEDLSLAMLAAIEVAHGVIMQSFEAFGGSS